MLGERVLVTTLTKRLAEDLSAYIQEAGIPGPLSAQRNPDAGARGDSQGPAPGRLRRAGRRQSAARRARSAGGFAGDDSRRRQGGLPAERNVDHSDDRPGGAEREREGDPVCRHDHAGDEEGDGRNRPPPGVPVAVQRGLRWAGIGLLVCIGLLLLLTLPSWGLLRNPQTGSLLEDSPLMEGLIFIISLVFLIIGLCYQAGPRAR